MNNLRTESCSYCGSSAYISLNNNLAYHFVECPVCGRYNQQTFPIEYGCTFKDEIASYLFYSGHTGKDSQRSSDYVFLGSKEIFERERAQHHWGYYSSEDEIKAFYPRTFTERIDRILLWLADRSSFLCDVIDLTRQESLSAYFVKRFDEQGNSLANEKINRQFSMINDYLTNNGLIDTSSSDRDTYRIVLKPEGWKRVDFLQREKEKISRNVFVAMSFAPDMNETRETIKKAITGNGFIPRIMDEIEHNHQIVPEMLYEIRAARFVIAELTGHNNGAYFEAGYALGCGKEVIQVCNKSKFGEDGHFDVKQINTVMWEDQDDLLKRLDARIKATIR